MNEASHLITENTLFRAENDALKVERGLMAARMQVLENEVEHLKETLRALQRAHFGTKSERYETEEQGLLFNEAELLSLEPDTDDEEETEATIDVKGHKKTRGHRKPLPETLDREIIKIELPEAERFAEDGTPLKIIGYELSEKLKYEPAKISVIEYHRAKYGVDSGDYVKIAKPIPSIVPKSIATPELIAAIVVAKYADGLPLYRMEEILTRQGVQIPRATMARWMIKAAVASQPLVNVLNDRLTSGDYAACDETRVQVLNEHGRKAEADSWMIVRATPYGSKKIVLFDYNISRAGRVMKDLFLDFKGYLQVDGLNCYDALAKREGIIRVGCNMHARRKFEEAKVTGAKKGQTLAEAGLKFYKVIYAVEKELKEKSVEERYLLRLEKATKIWDDFKAWALEYKDKVPRKSEIGEALYYFIDDYELLTAYLKDGRLEPDNGFTERMIRKFAIGRNNWMFSDSVDGANASSVLYSLVVTAKINRVNPYRALVKIFTELPKAQTLADIEALVEILLTPQTSQ